MKMANKTKLLEVHITQKSEQDIKLDTIFTSPHFASPEFAARVMYSIYCRYIDAVKDEKQIVYQDYLRHSINYMIRRGYMDLTEDNMLEHEVMPDEDSDLF